MNRPAIAFEIDHCERRVKALLAIAKHRKFSRALRDEARLAARMFAEHCDYLRTRKEQKNG